MMYNVWCGDPQTGQTNLFNLANVAVATNLYKRNKLKKQCPSISKPKLQGETKKIWGSTWGQHAQKTMRHFACQPLTQPSPKPTPTLRNDAQNQMFAGRPVSIGQECLNPKPNFHLLYIPSS